jgi:general secretion pathway protein I
MIRTDVTARTQSPASAPHHPSEAGFLLFEVLVAFLIAALTLVVLVRSAAESHEAVRAAFAAQQAVVRARSHLAALEAGGLVPGQREGDDGGGFTWHTGIVPLATAAALNGRDAQFTRTSLPRQTLYAVTVIIEWPEAGSTHRFVLQSERLGPAPQRSS